MRAKCIVIVGAQWGDEGKGKVVDLLAGDFDWIVRYQGGHNAGHTVDIEGRRFVLQLIPCGILRGGPKAVIGNGVVIDPQALVDEIESLQKAGISVDGRLFVSQRAHVILPYHRMIERAAESAPGRLTIGTTSRGIGPAYEDKMGRRGLRIADLYDHDLLRDHITASLAEKNAIAAALYGTAPLDAGKIFESTVAHAERIRPLVTQTAQLLHEARGRGESILLEGAQGTFLDIDHGTYPFVTSSSTTAGGACIGSGLPPTSITGVLGVSKAYATRVGGGPFPTELSGAGAEELRGRGKEFGSVTGRPRRVGWFDVPLLRYAAMVNGLDALIITKLDVLDTLDRIPVCVGYRSRGRTVDSIPATVTEWERLEPQYEELPGWKSTTAGIRQLEELPVRARDYLRFLEDKTGVETGMISTGPERNETITVSGGRMATLLGGGDGRQSARTA